MAFLGHSQLKKLHPGTWLERHQQKGEHLQAAQPPRHIQSWKPYQEHWLRSNDAWTRQSYHQQWPLVRLHSLEAPSKSGKLSWARDAAASAKEAAALRKTRAALAHPRSLTGAWTLAIRILNHQTLWCLFLICLADRLLIEKHPLSGYSQSHTWLVSITCLLDKQTKRSNLWDQTYKSTTKFAWLPECRAWVWTEGLGAGTLGMFLPN